MLQVFHMNKGQGEASYAQNCTVQANNLNSISFPCLAFSILNYNNKNKFLV